MTAAFVNGADQEFWAKIPHMKMFHVKYNAKKGLFWSTGDDQVAKAIASNTMTIWSNNAAMLIATTVVKANGAASHPSSLTYTFATFIELATQTSTAD